MEIPHIANHSERESIGEKMIQTSIHLSIIQKYKGKLESCNQEAQY